MDGLDVKTGLSRMMGKKPLYLTMLRKYVAGQKDAVKAIRSALDMQDHVTAQRIAHTLRGVSATVGASLVAGQANVVEAAIRHQHSGADVDLAINALSGHLSHLVTALDTWLARTPA